MNKKTIIVTGGAGYVGYHVAKLLSERHNVITIDKMPLHKRIPNVKHLTYDLLESSESIGRVFGRADICIHLAAEVGGVAFANKYPATILRNNSRIDLNVFELSHKANLDRLVYISSSLVYEKCSKFPLKEVFTNSIPTPSLSYGFEKQYGEQLCEVFKQEYGLSYSVCRLFNVYGKNASGSTDPNGHVIPDLIRKVKESDSTVELIGSKGILRNFSHVDDIAKGIIVVTESEKAENEIFNIADGHEYSLEEIVKILWKLLKKKGSVRFKYLPPHKIDVVKNTASVVKVKKTLGWVARIPIEQGLLEML